MENNPLSELNTARQNLNDSRLVAIKNDLVKRQQNRLPATNPASFMGDSMPSVDFIGMSQQEAANKIDLSPRDIDQRDVYKQVGDEMVARYDNFIPNIDNAAYAARTQSTGEKWSHGIQKLGAKTTTAVLGGTVGTITGLFNAIDEGTMSAIYTDDFNEMLDEYNEKLDFKLPNYYTEQERDMGFMESLGTANFWANDFLGGLSFTLGMIISEGIWGAATGGTSLIARGALTAGKVGRWSTKALGANKALRGLAKYKQPVKTLLGKTAKADLAALRQSSIKGAATAKLLNQARFIYTSAGYEAGVESRHYLKEMEDEWIMNFQQTTGRSPNQQELAEFYKETGASGNTVFLANMALVGSSNMAIFGKMLLGKSTKAAASNSAVKRNLFGVGYDLEKGTAKALKASTSQKVAGKAYSILKPMAVEGIYEEGGQSVAAKSVKDYVLSGYDTDATNDNLGIMDSIFKGIHETYGTKEGRKEVGLGMLIGIFGGGIATGGRFNDISKERKNVQELVDYRNTFSSDKVLATQITAHRLIANNKILAATKKQKDAAAKQDMTTEYLSEQQAILASIERDSALQGTEQGIADFEAYLATVDNKELAEELGIKEADAQAWKDEKLNDYTLLSNRYKENEKYVRAVIGDENFAGTDTLNTTSEQIIKAMTYNMTIGEQSKEFTEKIIADIRTVIAGEVSLGDVTGSLTVDQVLSNAPREAVTKYMDLSRKQKALTKQKAAVERQLLSEQGNKGKTTPEAHAAKLQNLQERILEIDDQIAEVNQTKTAAYRALGIQEEIVTQDELDNQEENLKALEETVEGYKTTNPQLYQTLTKLFKEYGKSKRNTISFNKLALELADPQIRIDTINGWLSGIIKKGKTLDESTKEFFKEQVETYETNQVQGKANAEEAVGDRTQTEQPEEEEEKGDEMNPPVKTTTTPSAKTPLEMLKQKISDIMGKNIYTTTYIGNDFNEAVKNKPSKEDTDRYQELVDKVNSKYITKFSQLLSAPKGWFKKNNIETGLTVEEIEELKELQDKLSNWKVLEGSVEGDNSLADLILLVEQLETEVEKSNTQTEITEEGYGTIKQAPKEEAKEDSAETSEGVQSPDQALVALIDDRGEAMYSFSHLDVQTLTRLFPNSTLEIVEGKVSKPIDMITKDKLLKLSKKEGTEFLLRMEGGDIKVKIGKRSRLNISKKSLDNSLESSNIAIVKYGSSNFMDVYEKLENGDMIPLKGDFSYASEIKGENIELLPEVVNNVKEGQVLITRINKNDSYNKMLMERYNRSKKTDEDFQNLMNDLHIYITDQAGNIVGSLRASNTDLADNASTKNLLELRRKAINMFLDENNKGMFSLNEAIPVRTVLVGSPNFVITDGKPQPINFTDTALDKVEDVGYYEGNTLKLRKMDGQKVIKTFLPKTSSKKIPVVILQINGKSVAFPVTLKSTALNRTEEVQDILDTNLRRTDKISKINSILIESGLKPTDYTIDNQGEVDINVEKVLEDLANVKDFPNLADWIDSSFKLESLKAQAQIGVDLDNIPFHLSKVMLDLSKTRTLGKADQMRAKYDGIENREIQLREDLQAAVKPILDGMNQYPDVDDVRWTDVLFYRGELFRNPRTDVDRRHNVNLLRDALFNEEGHRVAPPKAVREAYGEDFIEGLRKNIEELDRIIELKRKTRAAIKKQAVKEEVENENTNC